MENNKVIRSVCYYTGVLDSGVSGKLNDVSARLETAGYYSSDKEDFVERLYPNAAKVEDVVVHPL